MLSFSPVPLYANRLLSHAQMKEIRLGLEAGLDVSSYCGLIYSATDMKKKRLDLINGKTTKTTLVSGKESLLNSLRKNEFVISIEDNGNKAYAYIPWIPGNSVSKEDIYNDLRRREIIFGIKDDAITDMIVKRKMNEKVLIAEGVPAQKGADGWFEFFVRLDLPRIPAPLPDGGVDYVNIEAFEMVDEGEKIAVYHPAGKGTVGKNIYGETIHADNGIEKKPLRGVGFRIAPDGVTYVSKINGKFEYLNGQETAGDFPAGLDETVVPGTAPFFDHYISACDQPCRLHIVLDDNIAAGLDIATGIDAAKHIYGTVHLKLACDGGYVFTDHQHVCDNDPAV